MIRVLKNVSSSAPPSPPGRRCPTGRMRVFVIASHSVAKVLCYSLSLSLSTPVAIAGEAILFKQPFSPKHGWLAYGVAIILLAVTALIIAKKHKPGASLQPICKLVEKKYVGNKTIVYIIEYQQQRFLLADNQQALALHPLSKETADEQV